VGTVLFFVFFGCEGSGRVAGARSVRAGGQDAEPELRCAGWARPAAAPQVEMTQAARGRGVNSPGASSRLSRFWSVWRAYWLT
jgi:hypothetical protein